MEDPEHKKVLEQLDQVYWYKSTEEYARWAAETYQSERAQMRGRFGELVRFPRRDREARAHLAQRFGHLQAEPARPAGNERDLSAEIEKVADAHLASRPRRSIVLRSET